MFCAFFLVSEGGVGWGGVLNMYKFIHHQPARHRTSSYAMRYLIRQDEVGGDGVGWGGVGY